MQSAVKLRQEIMQVASGDLPMSKACPFVRRFFEVHGKVTKSAMKGKAIREYREMAAEVFKLLPREDSLTVKAETIFVGRGAAVMAQRYLDDNKSDE